MKYFLAQILVISILCSCSKDDTVVSIRLLNTSEVAFEAIRVNPAKKDVDFGNLKSGEYSTYATFELAYSYAFVELSIEGETYALQPTDYVGETPLSSGNYTYELDADVESQQLSLVLVED